MAAATITFRIPTDIATRLGADCSLFGGMMRDSGGLIVKTLDLVARNLRRAARSNRRLVVVAAVVGIGLAPVGALYAHRRLSGSARLARKLARIDEALSATIRRKHDTELTRRDLDRLRRNLDDILSMPGLEAATPRLKEADADPLLGFAEALRQFSERLRGLGHVVEPVPDLPSERAPQLTAVARALRDQLEYQQRHWHAAAPKSVAGRRRVQRARSAAPPT